MSRKRAPGTPATVSEKNRMFPKGRKMLRKIGLPAVLALFILSLFFSSEAFAQTGMLGRFDVSARSAIVVDSNNGGILYSKNPHLRLPPASTTKLMTVLLAMEKLPMERRIMIGRNAADSANSKAGLTAGASYRAEDLIAACLVASSNDAAVALAESIDENEPVFAQRMNQRALELGMKDTHFVNATGLTDKRQKQYSTAYDLTLLMRLAAGDRRIDRWMGLTEMSFTGSDGKVITLKNHNKMLWRTPLYVKGKTGWTFASRHTFVGTNYDSKKFIVFAMLSSNKPWTDIERLADLGNFLKNRNH